jgi:hypothetical protein
VVNHPPCRALLPSLPLLRLSRHVTPNQRALFDGRPRGDGYTHFRSAQGHSESGARTWYAVLGAVPSSLLLYYLGSHPPSRCALLAHTQRRLRVRPSVSRAPFNAVAHCFGAPQRTSTARRTRVEYG